MVKIDNTHLAIIDSKRGIPNSISPSTFTLENSTLEPEPDGTNSGQRSSRQIPSSRNNRGIPLTMNKLLIEFLHNTRNQQTETDFGLPEAQPFYSMPTFQNGGSSSSSRNYGEGRLHLQNRSEGRLRSNSNTSEITSISHIHEQRNGLPIQDSSIWNERKSKDFQQNDETRNGTFEKTRHPLGLLFGRHLHSREISGENESSHRTSYYSLGELGLFDQQKKEYINPIENTGIPRLYVQHKDNEDFSSREKNIQIKEPNKSSISHIKNKNMQMVCEFDWEDDSYDSGNRRSITTYQVFAERLSTESTSTSSKLGSKLYIVNEQFNRIELVDQVDQLQKWLTDSQTILESFDYNSRGRIRFRMGSSFTTNTDIREMDGGRAYTLNQCEGVKNNSIFTTTSCTVFEERINNQDIHRQHDSVEIHNKIRRNFVNSPTINSSGNTGDMQSTSVSSNISTHSRYSEYSSRYIESTKSPITFVRGNTAEDSVQQDKQTLGTTEDRRLRVQNEQSTDKILEFTTRPDSNSNRCTGAEMVEERDVPVSTMEVDPSSHTANTETKNTKDSVSHTELAHSTLVPTDHSITSNTTTSTISTQGMDDDRLAVIRQKRKYEGIDADASNFLEKSVRTNTARVYNGGWKKWVIWCKAQTPMIEPTKYDVQQVFKFLMEFKHLSSSHLNGIRSAIASTFKTLHPEEIPLANQPIIIEFFKAKRHQEIRIPTKSQLVTWDINILISYINKKLKNTKNLALYDLQIKTLLLLCMSTMGRPRSDIGRLQHRDIQLEFYEDKVVAATIIFREAKETNVKSSQLGLIEEEDLCPVRTLAWFMSVSSKVRQQLPEDHTLFLAYINDNNKVSSVRASTISGWIKNSMAEAGIDTSNYKPHSIRSASSTKAVEKGSSIEEVKQHANWSRRAFTFEDYYYKPTAQQSTSTEIVNSIFSMSENHTTLEDESESIGIVKGTPNNTIVDVDESKNVVNPTPWYRSWF
ncbi:hypothetical protein G6F32_011682 [Rhizopus arrhizus]|nr:hypothetical protein G6F32_011682 [Rhizopus arrhizus]